MDSIQHFWVQGTALTQLLDGVVIHFYSFLVLIKVMLCLAVSFTHLQKLRKCVMTERGTFTHWKLWPSLTVVSQWQRHRQLWLCRRAEAAQALTEAAGGCWVLEKSWNQNVPFPEYSLSDFIVIKDFGKIFAGFFFFFLKVKTDLKICNSKMKRFVYLKV